MAANRWAAAPNSPISHANLSWIHTFNREEDNRANSFVGVLGVAVPVAESTAIVTDFAHEQLEQKGRINNLIQVGVRQEVPGDITLGAGVGAGVGGSVTKSAPWWAFRKPSRGWGAYDG